MINFVNHSLGFVRNVILITLLKISCFYKSFFIFYIDKHKLAGNAVFICHYRKYNFAHIHRPSAVFAGKLSCLF